MDFTNNGNAHHVHVAFLFQVPENKLLLITKGATNVTYLVVNLIFSPTPSETHISPPNFKNLPSTRELDC